MYWREAMNAEISSMCQLNVWNWVDPPTDAKVIDSMWIFKKKQDDDNVKFKARLVAKGCGQSVVLDTYAPVIRAAAVKLLMAFALKNDYFIETVDVTTAYLNSSLPEIVYMKAPYLYGESDKVCLLNKSIYGLKQSAKRWYDRLSESLNSMGLFCLLSDDCIFANQDHSAIVGVYVDDLIMLTSTEAKMKKLKTFLNEDFSITERGRFSDAEFVGIEIEQSDSAFFLHQTKLITGLCETFSLTNANKKLTPVESGFVWSSTELDKCYHNITEYQSLVGSLLYVCNSTRPDASYTVGMLCRYMHQPLNKHMSAARRLAIYLHSTRDKRLVISMEGDSENSLCVYTDADFLSDDTEMRSTSGSMVVYDSSLIYWSSHRQHLAASSTCEAEMNAIRDGVCDLIFFEGLLAEISGISPMCSIHSDSQSAVALLKSGGKWGRTKHYRQRIAFIRQHIIHHCFSVSHLEGRIMPADMLTKVLTSTRCQDLCKLVGVLNI